LVDLYAKPVAMRYQGSDRFRTSIGGTISVLLILFVSGMFGYRMNVLLLKEGTTVKKNSLVSVTNQVGPIEDIGARGISFAFRLASLTTTGAVDDSAKYGTYAFRQN
jgi:hypothetical protein